MPKDHERLFYNGHLIEITTELGWDVIISYSKTMVDRVGGRGRSKLIQSDFADGEWENEKLPQAKLFETGYCLVESQKMSFLL